MARYELRGSQRIATVAYSTQTLLCWHVGRRLSNEHLQGGRAAYGKQIVVTVSRELTAEYGRGFSYAEIARMIPCAQSFPDEAIVVTLSQQLSWSHVHALLPSTASTPLNSRTLVRSPLAHASAQYMPDDDSASHMALQPYQPTESMSRGESTSSRVSQLQRQFRKNESA
jgi:DUF1016 N-terminal domain